MSKAKRIRKRFPKKYCPIDEVECIALNEKAQGIVEWNNKTYIVDEMLVGEVGNIVIYYEEETSGDARVIRLSKESPKRLLPVGHVKMRLGSYQTAHMTHEAQDEWKQDQVNKLFPQALAIKVGKRSYYRNKVVLHNGGFMPSGRNRKQSVIPYPDQFDLMDIDFDKYKDTVGDLIIRRLDTEIIGKPGDQKETTHTFMGKKFIVGLNSFYQVNNEMTELAYKEMINFIWQDAVVFDLFGGAATIAIHASTKAKEVYSVEINNNSHQDALENIKLNNTKNVHAICGDANEFAVNTKIKPDIIIVDPARSGLMEPSRKALNESGAKRIIYLSCNIYSQKEDVDQLTNYLISHVQPYDFFPQTYHIENLIILDKKN